MGLVNSWQPPGSEITYFNFIYTLSIKKNVSLVGIRSRWQDGIVTCHQTINIRWKIKSVPSVTEISYGNEIWFQAQST